MWYFKREDLLWGNDLRNVSTLIYYLLCAKTALPLPFFLPLFLLLASPLSLLFLFPLFSLLFFFSLLLGGLLL